MTTTRTRKRGCPFCKAKPDRCFLEFGGGYVWVKCLMCSSHGPEGRVPSRESASPESLSNALDEAWSKWNKRG